MQITIGLFILLHAFWELSGFWRGRIKSKNVYILKLNLTLRYKLSCGTSPEVTRAKWAQIIEAYANGPKPIEIEPDQARRL